MQSLNRRLDPVRLGWVPRLTMAVLAMLGGASTSPATAQEAATVAAQGKLPDNVIYVESNDPTAGKNGILAYRRDGIGKLTPLAKSPFMTGGTGVFDASFKLGPFDSDQNLVIDRERRLLFAVNSGSNSIAVFRIPTGWRAASRQGLAVQFGWDQSRRRRRQGRFPGRREQGRGPGAAEHD